MRLTTWQRRALWCAGVLYVALLPAWPAAAQDAVVRFDLTQAARVGEWQATHDVARLRHSAEGMVIEISGPDPYVFGPPTDFPAGQPLWLRLRLRADETGSGQVFFFRDEPSEDASVRFNVRGGAWEDVRLALPPLGPGYRFRFDPPGARGAAVLTALELAPRNVLREPAWPKPAPPALGSDALLVRSDDLELSHAPAQLGGFVLRVAGQPMAVGHTRPLIGYTVPGDGRTRWLPLGERARVTAAKERNGLRVRAAATDEDGATWEIEQRFVPSRGAIDVETRVRVSADRTVVYLPLLTLLPGVGAFGERKRQGLFAGLEYLDDEPGSSEADVTGPASRRQVPDTVKITFPLMAVAAGDHYVGLIWDKAPDVSALFDSPDRVFGSGGHVLGLLFPGSQGPNDRVEGSLLPHEGKLLAAERPLVARATIIGGTGKSVVPAVRQYVALRGGLPDLPRGVPSKAETLALLASGWLDSKVREGDLYRHAFWPGFGAQPAADAALLMDWLAVALPDDPLSSRLRESARGALGKVAPRDYNSAAVSHVRYPVPALVYGAVAENADRAREAGRALLARFEADGTVLYRKPPNGPDYGRTHFAPHANGLTALSVAALLEAATVSGDPDLLREGLRLLRALDRYANTVPRGAQTWEVPLHTPDILASAHLVRAYTLGYEMTGDGSFFEQARYWAWTGVPFVYLADPTDGPVGRYATIAVLGATNWVAPVWLGQPVQWCGLVYADAVARFARHDPNGPWKRLADGITASGIQQTWPRGDPDRQGLLPDYYLLRPQTRDGPAINPGTLQTGAARLFDRPALYDFRAFPAGGLLVHAPGTLEDAREQSGRVTFKVRGWPKRPYHVLVSGITTEPRVRINGRTATLSAPHQYDAGNGRLILQVEGEPTIGIETQ